MFDTIHHIAIIGSDYEKSKHFYVDLLGFEIIRENYRKERDDYKIDLACGEQEIELFIIKDAPARVNYPEALGLRHLAFKVKSVDDTVKELNAKGIATEPVRLDDYTGKKMTFLKKVLKIVKRERHIHSMMVLQRLTVSLISVMSLQELLRI